MAKRYEISDEAWDMVADLVTPTHTRGRPRSSDRLMLDGMLWLLRSGAVVENTWVRNLLSTVLAWPSVQRRDISTCHSRATVSKRRLARWAAILAFCFSSNRIKVVEQQGLGLIARGPRNGQ